MQEITYRSETLYNICDSVESRKYLLPGIQRPYVWKEGQITDLFDSLMQGFPIGSFLFWSVNGGDELCEFYPFIQNFNPDADSNTNSVSLDSNTICGVLDGQQRITSLYLGLKGTFKGKKLYLNISKKNSEQDSINDEVQNKFILKFLSTDEIKKISKEGVEKHIDFFQEKDKEENGVTSIGDYWFRVGYIFKFTFPNFESVLNQLNINNEKRDIAYEILTTLYDKTIKSNVFGYHLISTNDLNTVLNIFVRVNNGGTKLEKSDLLLSILVSKSEIDIKNKIKKLVDDVGIKNINKDFVLRVALCIFAVNVNYNLNNFSNSVVKSIDDNFDKLRRSILTAIEFVKEHCNYGSDKKESFYPPTILAYTLFNLAYEKSGDSYIVRSNFDLDDFLYSKEDRYYQIRKTFRDFVIKSLLSNIYGGNASSILSAIIGSVKNNDFKIDVSKINEKLPATKQIAFTDLMIDKLFEKDITKESDKNHIFLILTLLYDNYDVNNKKFEIDHIYPKSKLKGKTNKNCLANLQLLTKLENASKNDSMPYEWIENFCESDRQKIEDYKNNNYIPNDIELNIENFDIFMKSRTEIIRKRLKKILKG